jgi:chromosome segregation ATPase
MARRITRHRTPQDIQKLRSDAEALVKEAERRVVDIGKSAGATREQVYSIETRLKEIDEIYKTKLDEVGVVDAEIQEKLLKLRNIEGGINKAVSDCAKVEAENKNKIKKYEKEVAVARSEYASVAASNQKKIEQSLQELSSIEEKKETLEKKIAVLVEAVDILHNEEACLKGVLQKIPEARRELEELGTSKLVIQVEVKNLEEKLAAVQGKYNSEKSRYDEVVALRNGEEKALEARRAQIIEKEEEVDKKMRNLRSVKAGVDQSISRLERREQELELKLHLANKPSEVTEN